MLTVACVLVKGHVAFTPEYVDRLYTMAQRCISRQFEFVCLTDQPKKMPMGVRPIKIEAMPGLKGWWSKIELFKPGRFGGRVLYLDLDVLLLGSLDAIIDYPSEFALIPDGAPNFKGGEGLEVVKRYNSSVMVWDFDAVNDLYRDWTPSVAKRLWGDQDWIGERCEWAAKMPEAWFPRLRATGKDWGSTAKVVLCKAPKNHLAAHMWPWFDGMWR
jgi:hypothetical protein